VITQATDRSTPARERILDTASRLFYRDGLRATGIDRIIAESGVAKMSFYRHFPSKADLVRQFLDRRHEQWMAMITTDIEAHFAEQGLGAIATALENWFRQPDFRGCAFINSVAEAGCGDSPERQQSIAHKRALAAYVATLAGRLGLPQPEAIAAMAMIVIEGSIVRAQMGEGARVIPPARRLLLDLQRAGD
jgi:AcrR family transcriptional regulator